MRDPAQVAHICVTQLRVCFALCKSKFAHWMPIFKNTLKRQKKLFLISLLVLVVKFFTIENKLLYFQRLQF
jgi:hypothetical protein